MTRLALVAVPGLLAASVASAQDEPGGRDVPPASIPTVRPLYHTTGEVLDVISTPGLERIARFLAFFVKDVAAAPRAQVNP